MNICRICNICIKVPAMYVLAVMNKKYICDSTASHRNKKGKYTLMIDSLIRNLGCVLKLIA